MRKLTTDYWSLFIQFALNMFRRKRLAKTIIRKKKIALLTIPPPQGF
jgi:hypothetical protein